jgi:hypothetical protein
MKTITGETWRCSLSDDEYAEWVKYDDTHPQLNPIPMQFTLAMFINHLRRGINLNAPLQATLINEP